jgi:hypothetical protein
MKKVIMAQAGAVLLLVLVIVLLLWQKEPADLSLDVVEEQMNFASSSYAMEQAGAMRLKRAFGLNAAEYSEVLYYTPSNTMSVDEFLMIKVQDESQLETIRSAMENRLDAQQKAFDGYGTDQMALLDQAVIYQTGPYICFLVSEDAKQWRDTIKTILKE